MPLSPGARYCRAAFASLIGMCGPISEIEEKFRALPFPESSSHQFSEFRFQHLAIIVLGEAVQKQIVFGPFEGCDVLSAMGI